VTDNPQTIANLALAGAKFQELERGKLYLVNGEDGEQRVIDTNENLERPLFPAANRVVRDVRSFLEYLAKHGSATSEVWADTTTSTVTAVIDAHEGVDGEASHERHTITLSLIHTPEWDTWNQFDKVPQAQLAFANFIEENALDIVHPAASIMLELAQTFQSNTNVEFESGTRLATGETQLVFKETALSRAGQTGQIDIPEKITLALQPYVGGTTYGVEARFRYAIGGGAVKFTYLLDRPHKVLEEAFDDIVSQIRMGLPAETIKDVELAAVAAVLAPVLYGKNKR
jgi:uncharacterized protein YfdQ (DUF2303 family)